MSNYTSSLLIVLKIWVRKYSATIVSIVSMEKRQQASHEKLCIFYTWHCVEISKANTNNNNNNQTTLLTSTLEAALSMASKPVWIIKGIMASWAAFLTSGFLSLRHDSRGRQHSFKSADSFFWLSLSLGDSQFNSYKMWHIDYDTEIIKIHQKGGKNKSVHEFFRYFKVYIFIFIGSVLHNATL
mgnify:CR=1 FL=1